MALSSADEKNLANLEKKTHLARDYITAVAKGYKTGLYLWSRGGLGKSYLALNHLKELDVPHKLWNTRITGKGLFLGLGKQQGAIHVIEDCERLTKDADAQGVLRSALWAPPGFDRVVTWTTATDGETRFIFRGGLILISNRPLANLPELNALATRIAVLQFDATDDELIVRMRKLALQGYTSEDGKAISPEQCVEVTEYLLDECRAAACPINLRLQPQSFRTYLQWEADHSILHWKDIVAASVREAVYEFRHEANTLSPKERQVERISILRRIMEETKGPGEQLEKYTYLTSHSKSDFHRIKALIVAEKQRA